MGQAYLEGLDVAKALAKCVNGSGCVSLQHVADVTNQAPYTVNQ